MSATDNDLVEIVLSVQALNVLRDLRNALNGDVTLASWDYYGEAYAQEDLASEAIWALGQLPE